MKRIILIFILLISVLTFGCSSGGSSNPVSVATAPIISSLYPTSGGPGTLVTIQGSNFGAVQSTSILSYAGVSVTPTSWSNTLITLTLPGNAQNNGNFLVVVGGVYSNSSTVFSLSNPAISYISPATGMIGSEVTIYGQYFGTQSGDTYVTFNNTPAVIKGWSNTSINCTVPDISSSQSGSVSVIVWLDAYRYSNSSSFSLIMPTINSVNPNIDNIGALITISGQGFGQTQGTISLGSTNVTQIVSWSENTIQFRVPPVSYAGNQTLTLTAGGRQVYSSFNVAAPEATNYSPSPIGKNQTLTITGNHFGTAGDNNYVNRSVLIQDDGTNTYATYVSYNDTSLSFSWPRDNTFINRTVTIVISIGGLTQSFTVNAD